MEVQEILNNLIVQGELLEIDISDYEKVLLNVENITSSDDAVSRASSLVFRMCRDGTLDPWNIDLVAFVRFFREIITEEYTNLAFAGYIIAEAWNILYLKTLSTVDYPEEETIDESAETFTESVEVNHEMVDLKVPVIGSVRRPVRMVELLDAMKTAYYRGRKENRIRASVEVKEGSIDELINKLNMDEPDQEIARVLQRISSTPSERFYMEEFWGDTPEERSAFFVYSLFLMREGRIKLIQEIPYSSITVTKVSA
ncbi:MAG: hypothetical protein QW597_07320 [Thermoplasmataceae archaeon]